MYVVKVKCATAHMSYTVTRVRHASREQDAIDSVVKYEMRRMARNGQVPCVIDIISVEGGARG